jgi:hypothetical protein
MWTWGAQIQSNKRIPHPTTILEEEQQSKFKSRASRYRPFLGAPKGYFILGIKTIKAYPNNSILNPL